ESISQIIGGYGCVVTGIPDEQRGERLVAFYDCPDLLPGDLWRRLSSTELPKLWLPKRENIYQIDRLPTLGTGKLDLVGIKAKAQQFLAAEPVG
ncbi:MAG: hypothetical protein WBW33_27320, partial [Bryobacteraceae bacterium]